MNRQSIYIITAFITLVSAAQSGCKSSGCCLISQPDINITPEKTVIERQIVGNYREIEKDAWVVSSVKSSVGKGEKSSVAAGGDIKLLKAMKVREFHEDKIRTYKDQGAMGENNTGLVVYRKSSKYEKDKDLKSILDTVIKEENRARRTIFRRLLIRAGKQKPSEEDIKGFGMIFAEEQRALARKKDWIQDEKGRWNRK